MTPYLLHTGDNPDGPLSKTQAAQMTASLTGNKNDFYDDFATDFFSVDGTVAVTEEQRRPALALCHQAVKTAALACLAAFGSTDFRDDLLSSFPR